MFIIFVFRGRAWPFLFVTLIFFVFFFIKYFTVHENISLLKIFFLFFFTLTVQNLLFVTARESRFFTINIDFQATFWARRTFKQFAFLVINFLIVNFLVYIVIIFLLYFFFFWNCSILIVSRNSRFSSCSFSNSRFIINRHVYIIRCIIEVF